MALLFCKSEEAIETFIAHRDIAARDLLMPYGDVVMVPSIVLRIKRTLDAAEIDKIIWDVEARKALAAEHTGGAQTGARPSWRPSAFGRNVSRRCCRLATAFTRSDAVIGGHQRSEGGGCTPSPMVQQLVKPLTGSLARAGLRVEIQPFGKAHCRYADVQ